jgi:hypothetical protein
MSTGLDAVAQACNFSYSGSGNPEDCGSRLYTTKRKRKKEKSTKA